MSSWTAAIGIWLIDYYVLATALLAVAAAGMWWTKQSARRVAVVWATMAGLTLLAVICALPTWPRARILASGEREVADRVSSTLNEAGLEPLTVHENEADFTDYMSLADEAAAIEEPLDGEFGSQTAVVGPAPARPAWDFERRSSLIGGAFSSCLLVILLRSLWGCRQAALLCGSASVAPEALQAELERVVGPGCRRPRLLVSSRVGTAVALGIVTPTILLPAQLAREGNARGLRAALAHEWAHINNRDLWLLAIGRCLLTILFAHPVFWWLRRTVRDDQESLADADAANGANRDGYVEELLLWAQTAYNASNVRVFTGVGIWERSSQLKRRITMLLDEDLGVKTKCSHGWRYGWLGLLGLLTVSLSVLTLRPMPVAKAAPGEPPAGRESAAEAQPGGDRQEDFKGKACKVLADKRVEEPMRAIVRQYGARSGLQVSLNFLRAGEIDALVQRKEAECDVVLCMPKEKKSDTPVGSLPGARKVAWKHPSGEPVWAAVLTEHPEAAGLVRFIGGPTGHRLWSESKAGFTITTGKTHAEAFDWVVENRVKHTYPLTAVRMLREIGGIRDGICIDIGCGTGNLDVEIAKRSNFTIIGLDIDPDMKPLFEKRIGEAGLEDRLRFVTGDAQKLPFADDSADVIVSRGTLTFIPDIGKCLREVDRVLKPTGVAFLGGRYVYTPQSYKISNEKLEKIVRESGVPGAKLVEHRGQWVKIIGAKAPKAAHQFQAGPHMLANRFIADYAITEGTCLLVCMNDGGGAQGLQQGFLEMTELQITALYPSEKVAAEAEKRIRDAKLADRITCEVGVLDTLPFEEASFDLVAGTGPMLIWGERQKKMREIHRVLRSGGAALVGGRYLGMPDFRKVSSKTLRDDAAKTGITSIRVLDEMGQWVEIRKANGD